MSLPQPAMLTPADIFAASVLIVDDQDANVQVLEQMLRGAGYTAVTSTQDPRTVCTLHRQHHYDLILLDLQMPRLDGFQVMADLQAIEAGDPLPVLVLVITAQPGHKLRALQAGAKDFVSKPFDLTEVLLRVHNLLEVRLLHRNESTLNLARLENAQRIAGLGDWEYDFQEQRLRWSEEVYRILGLARADFPPDSALFYRQVHPDDLAFVHAQKKAAAQGRRMDFEHRLIRADGAVRHIHQITAMVLDAAGQPALESGTIQDVTERKLADEALRESEQWLRAVFEQAAVGVVQTDVVTGRFVRANQRFCDIVGYTPAEIMGLTFTDITHPQDMGLNLENVTRLRAGAAREFTQEKRYVCKDGSSVWTSVAVSAIGPPGEAPVSFVAFVQDISERKRLDEHFLQAQKMEALGQFSGGMAHDFNNILAAIGGYTELSRMLLKENPEVREHLGAVLQAAKRAADLVRQILTFSQQHPQARQVIRLQPVVTESLKLMRATIPATIEFAVAVDAAAPTVLANAGQVHQILMNLGINAAHAMNNGTGRLQVTLEKFTASAEFAATQPRLRPGDYVRLSVSDTGCGMDPATLRRIYEPFFTTKPPGEGTGLGLSVVHGIMESHDGAITVHSRPGTGTVFQLYFPVHAGEAVLLAVEPDVAPRGAGERILVVDDEELLARLHQQTLVTLGYAAEFATEPAAVLALVRADPGRFDLVLTDQTMPGMTGLELAVELREIRRRLPVILMTGYSLSLTTERVEAAGIRQLLLKPISIQSLGVAVHAELSSPASTPTSHGPNPTH